MVICHSSFSVSEHKYCHSSNLHLRCMSTRYLDSVTNKDSTLPPIPHLHSLLTDNGEPHPEVDIFKLVCSSYEVLNDVCLSASYISTLPLLLFPRRLKCGSFEIRYLLSFGFEIRFLIFVFPLFVPEIWFDSRRCYRTDAFQAETEGHPNH